MNNERISSTTSDDLNRRFADIFGDDDDYVEPEAPASSSPLDRIINVTVYDTALDGYAVRKMIFRDAVVEGRVYPTAEEAELLRAEGIIVPTREEAERLNGVISVEIHDWDADATYKEKMSLHQAILEGHVRPTARDAELLRAEGHVIAEAAETETETEEKTNRTQIKSIKVWKSPDKRETRIYVRMQDGREGCLYKTGNRWHPKGSTEGDLTEEEWAEARRISIFDGAWHTVFL